MLHIGLTHTKQAQYDWPTHYQERAQQALPAPLKDFYQAGCPSANTPINHTPLLALDIETTGLNAKEDAIVSIGLIPFDLQRIYCRQAQHWLLQPDRPLTASSVVIHGLTHSDLASAPQAEQVLEQLLPLISGKLVVVHYKRIEREFLAEAAKRLWQSELSFPVIDTLELEARLHRKPLSLWQRLRGQQPLSVRLAASRARYNLPPYQQHHALTDALATAELLQAQISHHFDQHTPVQALWG